MAWQNLFSSLIITLKAKAYIITEILIDDRRVDEYYIGTYMYTCITYTST